MARYPEVRVALQLSDRMVDAVDEGFDVAIRTGALDDSSLTVKPLAPYRLMISATPDYLAQHAPIESPYDLLAHDLIVFGKTNLAYEWIFMRDKEKICLPISGRLTINDNTAQLNVVLAGGGIILQSADLLQPYVALGLLVPILMDYQLPSRAVNAVYASSRLMTPKLRSFLDFLGEELGK
ncbi:LysR substrate-binding domain-containing protein [Neisseriaceae bacterium B1]